MPFETVVFVFDYVDPLSFLVHRVIEEEVQAGRAPGVELVGLELRFPPAPIMSPEEALFADRWALAREEIGPGTSLSDPLIVPWTRKAHELRILASEKALGAEVHSALFRAFLEEGKDIGRVDVLVAVAAQVGLDYTEAKAVLDIDKFSGSVEQERVRAMELGVRQSPALLRGSELNMGWEGRDSVVRFLRSSTSV